MGESQRLLLCICLGALACLPATRATPIGEAKRPASLSGLYALQSGASDSLSPTEAKRVIAGRARQVISALKAGNMARLSALVHPEKGVRFSAYAYVSPGDDLVFRRKQLPGLWASRRLYVWGSYDGSGDAIRLTFRRYYRRFVFDHDFSRAKRIGYNEAFMGRGNTLNNIRDIYPRGIVVEYHFPGFDPKYGGADWKSLWLVFEKRGSVWYLVGIVHDEWTI
jgi:hypothetical protein